MNATNQKAVGSILSIIWPQTVEVVHSKINGPIEIQKLHGTYRVSSGGLTQSGGLVDEIWAKGIAYLKKCASPKKILILGVGAGGVIRQLSKTFPDALLTGIEIDSKMIDIGNKYFSLNKTPHFEAIITDAEKFIKTTHDFFDFIVIDLYLGDKSPIWLSGPTFIKAVQKRLSNGGIVLINRLLSKEKVAEIHVFNKLLKNTFASVERVKTPANYLFAVRNYVE